MMKVIFCLLFLFNVSAFAAGEVKAASTSLSAPLGMTATATNETESVAATGATTTTVVNDAKLAEDQIPLNISANKKATETTSTSSRLFFTGFILVVLLSTAYYFVRKYKTSNKINKSNMQIKVLSQHHLGPKKSLAIIRVSGESILIGVTDTNISMIKSLSLIDDEVPAETPQNFGDALNKENANSSGSKAMVDELDEEFSFSGVKDSVSKKIKSMRSFS